MMNKGMNERSVGQPQVYVRARCAERGVRGDPLTLGNTTDRVTTGKQINRNMNMNKQLNEGR